MNTSDRTTSAARGLALFAEFMNCDATLSPWQEQCETRWREWASAHASLVPLVTRVHGCMFETLLRDRT